MKARQESMPGPLRLAGFLMEGCVCVFGFSRPGKGATESVSSSHIEVIERLTRQAVTWTPSREAHVAGLEQGSRGQLTSAHLLT